MVGILEPTNTPVDRVIWIPLEGVQTMGGHNPLAATELSAVLVRLRAPTAGLMLDMAINKVNKAVPNHPGVVALTCCYHNLLRTWADA